MTVSAFLRRIIFPRICLRSWRRDTRGSAGIELVIGSITLITVSTLMFNLYQQASIHATLARTVVTVADFASRETFPRVYSLSDLVGWLHFAQIPPETTVTFVISSIAEDPDDLGSGNGTVQWQWLRTMGAESGTPPDGLGADCPRIGAEGEAVQSELTEFSYESGETIVVAEACLAWPSVTRFPASAFGWGLSYTAFILPYRNRDVLPEPPSGTVHEHHFVVDLDEALKGTVHEHGFVVDLDEPLVDWE